MPRTGTSTIAKRRIRLPGRSSKYLTISLGMPYKTSKSEWTTVFTITGGRHRIKSSASGVDGMQSLIVALDGIRAALDAMGQPFAWLGEPGDTGFPRYVPNVFGSVLSNRIGRMIDKEIATHIKSLQARRK